MVFFVYAIYCELMNVCSTYILNGILLTFLCIIPWVLQGMYVCVYVCIHVFLITEFINLS